MKKAFLIILICFVATQYVEAQNKKIYVSRHGGTKKLLNFGKIGYNIYKYNNGSNTCDTLICRGSGYEICKIDKHVFIGQPVEDAKYLNAFNTAICATEKQIHKSKKDSGQFNLIVEKITLSIKYTNADQKGNADIEIEVL